MDGFTIKLPTYALVGVKKKRKYQLNFNMFRKQDMRLNNNIKSSYEELIKKFLPAVHYKTFEVHYTLYLGSKRLTDIANVLSIVDKNFCDAFVRAGCAPDDNHNHLKKLTYEFGGYDDNKEGYVIVTVINTTKKET